MFFATYDDLCARARCFDVEQRGRATVKTPLERLLCASLADDLSGRFSISNRFEKFRKGTSLHPPQTIQICGIVAAILRPKVTTSLHDNLYRRIPVILVRSRGDTRQLYTRDTSVSLCKREGEGHWLIVLSRTVNLSGCRWRRFGEGTVIGTSYGTDMGLIWRWR